MDIRNLLAVVVLAGAGPIEAETSEMVIVPVCITFPTPIGLQAQAIASRMFREIGVQLEWLSPAEARRATGLVIRIIRATPPEESDPDALAQALVFEGTQIEIFYERVRRRVGPLRLPALFGHVLAHEIAHVLQAVNRHTKTGIMKARWDNYDYDRMAWKPFSFTDQDAQLIHAGLESRNGRTSRQSPKAVEARRGR